MIKRVIYCLTIHILACSVSRAVVQDTSSAIAARKGGSGFGDEDPNLEAFIIRLGFGVWFSTVMGTKRGHYDY